MHIQKGKRLLKILVMLLFYAFFLYLLFYSYAVNLGYDTERNHIIHAGLYQDGEKQEDVTIEITGAFRDSLFQRDTYEGRFAVSCLPETQPETIIARIKWSKGDATNSTFPSQTIFFQDTEKELTESIVVWNYSITILNQEMTELLWERNDGSYIATSEASLHNS